MADSGTLARHNTAGGIRRLPPEAINRIAAGEVVERPAAAVKELVENALDAGARSVSITCEGGGLSRILIEDDGCGMTADEIQLATERHATSKLSSDSEGRVDLLNISTLGFRGEALPSIGAVARLSILSKSEADDMAHEFSVEGGVTNGPRPAAWSGRSESGTRIDVRDLFFATPARLKFMKSERAEATAINDVCRRLAMSRPDVSFKLTQGGRTVFRLDADLGTFEDSRLARLSAIMGREFQDNALSIDAHREGVRVSGFAGLPTLNRSSASHQYLFVNNRPVRDKLLTGVVRAAYQDFLARDRHPMVALFVDLDPEYVDVNVHPAKTEVRFRDASNVRGLLIGALRHALADAGHRASTTVAGYALGKVQSQPVPVSGSLWRSSPSITPIMPTHSQPSNIGGAPTAISGAQAGFAEPRGNYSVDDAHSARVEPEAGDSSSNLEDSLPPLGLARAQLHETYIVSQTKDGIVIVDQHAAHERLVYEQMKSAMAENGVRRQALLIPEVVELGDDEAQRVIDRADELLELGLEVEAFGGGAVCVRATPALFGEMDVLGLIQDLADDFATYQAGLSLKERFEEVMGNMACRGSVRSGRRLNGAEMNALLRQMEATPYSGQCNHGRPTYVELKLSDIEKLFGRR